MVMRTRIGSGAAQAADGTVEGKNGGPEFKSPRELAKLIAGDDLQSALSALERISGNQKALAYVAKNGCPKLRERAVELLTGMLSTLTDTGAILAVALHSKDADAKAEAGARILNMDTGLIFRKPRKALDEDDLGALTFIAEKHPDDVKRQLADCKLPITSKTAGVEFTEEVFSFSADRLAEILEATQE